ncbi:MAG: putative endoglucanase [candidate division BRC1 bacterium ADurb.BinA364]|nr:MAG: putative endoglucanase [candidate division BRC1 bacterium ADurb.BinA364]
MLAFAAPFAKPAADAQPEEAIMQWDIGEIAFRARDARSWWEFPARVVFTHRESNAEIAQLAYWRDGSEYRVRYALPSPGLWTWRSESGDPQMDGLSGAIAVAPAGEARKKANPNLRGHLRPSASGRFFEYADGQPFFLLADTIWSANTLRCGLGQNGDGPFFQYLRDRKEKKFTAILHVFLSGFGDDPEPIGQANEGGYPFPDGDLKRLNASYFRYLDARMQAIWEAGFVSASPPTWFGKVKYFIDYETAKRISAYLMVRYGAYNLLWSLSGEYQYAMRDGKWTDADLAELGEHVQAHNPWRHPVSIHPSGGLNWKPPHNRQSPGEAFQACEWLNCNWLQTGQDDARMRFVAIRPRENYERTPPKPVFLSEANYEGPPEAKSLNPSIEANAYEARWQAWTAFLNGACGYGYGAHGLWGFYDPEFEEPGKKAPGRYAATWREAIAYEGGGQLRHVRDCLSPRAWTALLPRREWLEVDGEENPWPSEDDIAPPHCAAAPGNLYVFYIPRGNAERSIRLAELAPGSYRALWFDPRTGESFACPAPSAKAPAWEIPPRPDPAGEDWALVLEKANAETAG